MDPIETLIAIERGRTDRVLDLIGHASDAQLIEALNHAAYFGDVTACRLLLNAGVALSSQGADLGLMAASFHGHWRLVQFLIELGADANCRDAETGETPLHAALTNEDRLRYDRVVQVLLAAGADVNAATLPGVATGSLMRDAFTRGETPLHRAALFGTPATLTLLIKAGAHIDAADAHGETPLGYASWARRPVEVLLPLLYGEHRIREGYRSLRENLAGEP
jgi:ankyrin repeat protein